MGPRRPRVAPLLVVAAILAAACSDAGEVVDAVVDDPTTTIAPGSPSDSAPPGDPGEGTQPPATAPGGSTPPGPAPDTTQPSAAPTTTSTQPVPALGPVGAYAPFYLRPGESSQLALDVHAQAGAAPRDATLNHVRSVLADVSGKQVVLNGGSLAGGAKQWTAGDIRALADRTGLQQSRERAVVKLLFLRGGFADSDTVLGVAVRSDVAAVFADRVDEAAGPLSDPARIETAVTTHELGHLLGLVDLFLSTGRQDPEHPGHSPNRDSVMYYAVESTLVGSLLEGGPPTTFDAQDRADLTAIRNS